MEKRSFLLLALALVFTLNGLQMAMAECRDGTRPVLSLTQGQPVSVPGQGDVEQLDYFEIVYARSDPSADGPVEIESLDGESIGRLIDGQYIYFVGNSCQFPGLTMAETPQTSFDISNPLQAKAIVGITTERVAMSEIDAAETQISLRNGPSPDAEVIGSMRLYSIVYVHAQFRVPGQGSDWYFVGSESQVPFVLDQDGNLAERVGDTLLGWVNEVDLIFWSQRQAVFPANAKAETRVFKDPDMTAEGAFANIGFIDETDPDRLRPVLKFPLIGALEGDQVYEIALPSTNGEVVVAEGARQELGDIRAAENAVDFLFVLDNSESMLPYREAVLNGMLEAMERVPNRDQVRIATAMFGDIIPIREEFDAWSDAEPRFGLDEAWVDQMVDGREFQFWLDDFGQPGIIPTVAEINAEFGPSSYRDVNRDAVEMGLPALQLAVANVRWRRDAIRMVVYLGDDGSRTMEFGDLARGLNEADVKIIALNVAGRNVDTWNELWIDQVEQLGEALVSSGGVSRNIATAPAYQLGDDDVAATRQRINDTFISIYTNLEFVLLDDPNLSFGDRRALAQARAAELGVTDVEYSGNLFDGIFSPERAAEMDARLADTDVLLSGFYPIEDSEIYISLTRREFVAVTNALEETCVGMSDTASIRRTIEDMAEKLGAAFLGEDRGITLIGAEESIQDFFSKTTFLPASYFSVFVDMDLNDFEDLVRTGSDEERDAIRNELCLSHRLMSLIRDGRNGRRETFEQVGFDDFAQKPIFEPRLDSLPRFEWLWRNESGISLYFVPEEFFPRGTND